MLKDKNCVKVAERVNPTTPFKYAVIVPGVYVKARWFQAFRVPVIDDVVVVTAPNIASCLLEFIPK